MKGSELKEAILKMAIEHDGIDPVVAKWLLKLEIVITEQGDEIRHLREEVRELRNHEPL